MIPSTGTDTGSAAASRGAHSPHGEDALELGTRIHWEEPQRAGEIARQCAEEALRRGDRRLYGRALVLEAAVAMRRGALERTFELLADAERETERCDAPDLRAELALAHSRLSFLTGAYSDALAHAEEAVGLADAHGLDEIRLAARRALNLVLGNIESGSLAASVRELLELAVVLRHRREESMARNDVAYELLLRGELEEADGEIERAIEIGRELGPEGRFALAYAIGTRAEIRLASGDARAAIADFDASLSLAGTDDEPEPYLTGMTLQAKVQALVADGRLDEAVETGKLGLALLGDRVPHARVLLLRSVAAALRASGRVENAYDALERSAELERSTFSGLTDRQLALQRATLEAQASRRESELLAAKNRELEELVGELGGAHLELGRRMGQLEQLRDRLREQADRDWLTGLRNRRFLARHFRRIAAGAAASGAHLSLAVVDIDRFKSVNDRFGHDAGDRILKEVAKVLGRVVRASDVVVRSGGEEFVVVMPRTSAAEAAACCERLRCALRARSWDELDPELTITLSAGVASTEEPLAADSLLAVADRRLYEAKAGGRDRVVAPERESLEPPSLEVA